MNLCVVGAGYVGLTAAVIWASQGHWVVCVDVDEKRVANLEAGRLPLQEPGLEELYQQSRREGRLRFTPSLVQGLVETDLVFLAVGTPSRPDGSVDLRAVEAVVEELATVLPGPATVVIKSTVPVGTAERVEGLLNAGGTYFHTVLSNPEFLREGSAVLDFCQPDRIVIGADSPERARPLQDLYTSIDAPVLITSRRCAEMIKYASNAFLATRISFINELSGLCEALQVDAAEVARGMGLDHRIGPYFLQAGVGYGGSCFPKDVAALQAMYREQGLEGSLVEAAAVVNEKQRRRAVTKLHRVLGDLAGRQIAVWGLSFKPGTDDIRSAPALDIVPWLTEAGAVVRIYDPAWREAAGRILPDAVPALDPYEAADGSDAALLLTEWEEFRQMDPVRLKRIMRRPVIIDGRNCLDGLALVAAGFHYEGFGRLIP